MDTKNQETKPTILITGIAGLLGSNLAKWIIKNHPEYRVIGIDAMIGGIETNIPPEAFTYYRDLAKDDISGIFEQYKPDYVFHFAAYAAEGLSPFIRKFNYENNVVSTVSIVNECIKHSVKRLVYTSSMSVYGHGGQKPPFTEDMPRCPIDPYGVSKAACEMDIEIAGEQHGLDYCIIRPHNVYGPGQNIWDPYRNVLGIWMYRAMHDLPMRIYGDGQQKRAFTYIDDILEPLWNAAVLPEASRKIINMGDTLPTSIKDAATLLKGIIETESPIKVKIEYCEARHEVKNAFPSGKLSEGLLGFKYKTFLPEGLTAMWKWACSMPPQDLQHWESYELDKGIYSYWKLSH